MQVLYSLIYFKIFVNLKVLYVTVKWICDYTIFIFSEAETLQKLQGTSPSRRKRAISFTKVEAKCVESGSVFIGGYCGKCDYDKILCVMAENILATCCGLPLKSLSGTEIMQMLTILRYLLRFTIRL